MLLNYNTLNVLHIVRDEILKITNVVLVCILEDAVLKYTKSVTFAKTIIDVFEPRQMFAANFKASKNSVQKVLAGD